MCFHRTILEYATYRESTVATQIDHVLVSAKLAAQFDNATTLPGVCGDDHEIVIAKMHYDIESSANEEHRPIVKWRLDKKNGKLSRRHVEIWSR